MRNENSIVWTVIVCLMIVFQTNGYAFCGSDSISLLSDDLAIDFIGLTPSFNFKMSETASFYVKLSLSELEILNSGFGTVASFDFTSVVWKIDCLNSTYDNNNNNNQTTTTNTTLSPTPIENTTSIIDNDVIIFSVNLTQTCSVSITFTLFHQNQSITLNDYQDTMVFANGSFVVDLDVWISETSWRSNAVRISGKLITSASTTDVVSYSSYKNSGNLKEFTVHSNSTTDCVVAPANYLIVNTTTCTAWDFLTNCTSPTVNGTFNCSICRNHSSSAEFQLASVQGSVDSIWSTPLSASLDIMFPWMPNLNVNNSVRVKYPVLMLLNPSTGWSLNWVSLAIGLSVGLICCCFLGCVMFYLCRKYKRDLEGKSEMLDETTKFGNSKKNSPKDKNKVVDVEKDEGEISDNHQQEETERSVEQQENESSFVTNSNKNDDNDSEDDFNSKKSPSRRNTGVYGKGVKKRGTKSRKQQLLEQRTRTPLEQERESRTTPIEEIDNGDDDDDLETVNIK